MATEQRITISGRERPFNAETWQQLLTAFAYVLHERRKVAAPAQPAPQEKPGATP